ncbi:Pkinase-domain-containing protein [Dentipellis sp. KUC8613]|nr:Pkinase-domain-containing protein [Dentipellis sp. KUC8613]
MASISSPKPSVPPQHPAPLAIPVPDAHHTPTIPPRDEEPVADYNVGGYLQIKVNDTFKDNRYRVVRKLGWGHFSTVWLVKDNHEARHCALKVVKSAGRYTETARDEIKLLQQIADTSPSHLGRAHVVSFLDHFTHTPLTPSPSDSHVCITFEPLGENLLALIEKNRRKGVAPCVVKSIARQVLLGLQYLHEECDLVHTDIKPENIMMSIPNVESHILNELSSSPGPQSCKFVVPPNARRRGSMRTLSSRSHPVNANRSVHIFESQPLSSPSRSHIRSARLLSSSTSSGHTPSSYARSLLSDGETNRTADTTPATSLGSAMAKLQLSPCSDLAPAPALLEGGVNAPDVTLALESDADNRLEAPTPKNAICPVSGPILPPSGPSLLTQTDPRNHTHQRHTSNSSIPPLSLSPSPSLSPRSRTDSLSPPPTSRSLADAPPPFHPIQIKIADLGNATPSKRHYTEDIQTRQYRSPEAIIGRSDWDCKVDIWSVACVIFELLTAEYLFEPQSQGQLFSKDDDHMAQIIELLGDLPPDCKQHGRYSRELFDHSGSLRYIKHLKPWPLERVMQEKYLFGKEETHELCAFLKPMLETDPKRRATAGEMAQHPWLDVDWENEGASLDAVIW